MRRESQKWVWDAVKAADLLLRVVAERDLPDYLGDEVARAAVERQFETIGEVVTRLRRGDPDAAARIPDVRGFLRFRNIIVHHYEEVDHKVVWGLIQDELPALVDALRGLAGEP